MKKNLFCYKCGKYLTKKKNKKTLQCCTRCELIIERKNESDRKRELKQINDSFEVGG